MILIRSKEFHNNGVNLVPNKEVQGHKHPGGVIAKYIA